MEGIAVHWEAAAPRSDHARCAGQVAEIRSYHVNKGYSDIAYNFLVCNHGQVFTGRGWVQSAATCNSFYNSRYWSVCWMGGPGHTPTAQALTGIRSVIDQARAKGAAKVIGHRDACATECPGADLWNWVRAGYPAGASPIPPPPTQEDDLPYTEAQLTKIVEDAAYRAAKNAQIDATSYVKDKDEYIGTGTSKPPGHVRDALYAMDKAAVKDSIMHEPDVREALKALIREVRDE